MENNSINVDMRATETKTGRVGEKILTRKAYGEKTGLTGQRLKAAHHRYIRQASEYVMQKLTEKGAVLTSYSENPKTGSFSVGGMTGEAYANKGVSGGKSKVIDFAAELKKAGIELSVEQLAVLANRDKLAESLAV
jgi:hypothetical protein